MVTHNQNIADSGQNYRIRANSGRLPQVDHDQPQTAYEIDGKPCFQ